MERANSEHFGTKVDVRLSYNDYEDMIDNIVDERLDDHMMLKLKKLSRAHDHGKIPLGGFYVYFFG